MFDKKRIIYMTKAIEDFVRDNKNIYILPEVLSPNVLSLLKRINANVKAILIKDNVNPPQNLIKTPTGDYSLMKFSNALTSFEPKTGIIASVAKPMSNPIFSVTFNVGSDKIDILHFAFTDEEATAIYDRLTIIEVLKRYQEDGINSNARTVSCRFARGMSTFIDSQFQDVKVKIWDRREFVMPKYDVEDAAIVIQGPLEYRDNYTITTARLYREWYPKAPIVVSTWKNEATKDFREKCKELEVTLLENELPAESGALHVNYQLESSLKGAEYVKNNTSAKFVLKCRTDQRLNRLDFLIYFKNLLKMFPPNGDKLKQRVIMLCEDKWPPFYMRDYIFFGSVEDINNLFSISRQDNKYKEYMESNVINYANIVVNLRRFRFLPKLNLNYNENPYLFNFMNKYEAPDVFIPKHFYEEYIAPIDPTKLLQTYWKFLRDYLIIVGANELDFDWQKYNSDTEDRTNDVTSSYHSDLDFGRWLDIYLNYKEDNK